MLNLETPKDRIIAAAMRLAETRGWRDLSLAEIAADANVPLAELRRSFTSKSDILAAFTRAVDDAVLERVKPSPGDVPRDRLFDVIITRFEVMQPYKAALKRIRDELRLHPGSAVMQLRAVSKSQYWMMQAAGINAEGARGKLRLKGLLAVYGDVFRIWLEDTDEGMARTMAALDRRLRRGEDMMKRVDRFCGGVEGFVHAMRPGRAPAPSAPPSAGPSEPPPPPPGPSAPPSPAPS